MPENMQLNQETPGREKPIETTEGIQVNYPNFKQKLAEREFYHLKSQQRPAARCQMPPQSSNVLKVGNSAAK